MNWYEQASDILKSLSNVQDGMVLDWMKFVSAMPQSSKQEVSATLTPLWRAAILQSIRDMDDSIDPTAKNVIHKLLASQLTTMRLIETAMETWQAIAPHIQNGDDWRAPLDACMQKLRSKMQQDIRQGIQSLDNMEQVWEKYVTELRNLGMPWLNSMQLSSSYYDRLLQGDSASVVEMTSIYSDAFQDSFSSLLNIPNMGNTRKIEESSRKNFASWLDLQKASYAYQTVVVDAWLAAFESLMQELAQLAVQGEILDSIRDFLNRWSALADETFKKTFHSEQYITLQSAFVNAVMNYRKTQALMNEVVMEFYNMPTRSEIDEAHRRIYELQKELRILKREIALLKSDLADKDC